MKAKKKVVTKKAVEEIVEATEPTLIDLVKHDTTEEAKGGKPLDISE